jgi:hypothetical protein
VLGLGGHDSFFRRKNGQNKEEVIVQRKLSVKQLSCAATPGGGFTHAFVSRNPFGSLLFIISRVILANQPKTE